MDVLPLQLFPPGSLDASVITTVWIGVFVVATFNLRFGWVLSGLVVPGYLVPLLVAKPIAAGVVVLEAVLTYGIVAGLAGPLARLEGWGSFFGRDRFFALVLASVVVRLVLDAWLLVEIGEWLTQDFGINFDYRNNLHSFGLIIIALIANQFWKTGLLRGSVPLVVTVGLSFLLVRYGLMEFTNFRISSVTYMFEDVTASILAGPKAYIILLTTAFVASRMNLFYGWEFNGILIPSLLALQWYEPTKILVSFLEAFLILALGAGLLRTPLLRNMNIEGARKLLLFFNIAFVWKLLLGWGIYLLAPQLKVSDFFAFGYLLSTLMAIKMHDKDIALRLTWSTLTTSAVAILIASIIGFALTLLPSSLDVGTRLASGEAELREADDLVEAVADEKQRMYAALGTWTVPLPTEIEAFRAGVRDLASAVSVRDEVVSEASARLAAAGYEVVVVAGRHLLLREREVRGWGSYVITPGATGALIVGAPAPLHETGTTEAALWLAAAADARAFALGGPRRSYDRGDGARLLEDRNSPFLAFHATLTGLDAVHVRGYTVPRLRALFGLRDPRAREDAPDIAWVDGTVPAALGLGALRDRLGGLDVRFQPLPEANALRGDHVGSHVELTLSRLALRRLASGLARPGSDLAVRETDQRIDGYLQDWLFGETRRIAERGSGLYEPPDLYQLLFFDEEILAPLLDVLASGHREGSWTDSGIASLEDLSRRLGPFGYRLLRYHHVPSAEDFVILAMREDDRPRYWGTYVFRAGRASPWIVQVPRPGYEGESFDLGLQLFERTDATALMIAGAHPYAQLDGSSDVLRADNARSLFSLVGQVIRRERSETAVLQARALGFDTGRPLPEADLLLASDLGVVPEMHLQPLVRNLLALLREDGYAVELVDGDPEDSGLETGNAFQSRYLSSARERAFVALWLSPLTRAAFRQRDEDLRLERDLEALGLELEEIALSRWLPPRLADDGTLEAQERELLRRYAERRDLVALDELQRRGPLRALIDIESRQAFLAFMDGPDANATVRALASIARRTTGETVESRPGGVADALERFRATRAAFLVQRGAGP